MLTTNRLNILDPALIRSKRLKVQEVSGHLRLKDITDIVRQTLKNIPLAPDLSIEAIVESAKGLCNTPADYSAFVEKARSLRSTEYEVLQRIRDLSKASSAIRDKFVKFTFKTLMGIPDAVDAPQSLRSAVYGDPAAFLSRYGEVIALLKPVTRIEGYPLMSSHLNSARQEISHSPVKIGKMQLDEFLEAELSQEPQVGFIIGVGANDVTGVLLPIATSLTYSLSAEKVLVTGAVSSGSAATAELDMVVKMTQQSAQEALTMVKNYLQELDSQGQHSKAAGGISGSLHHPSSASFRFLQCRRPFRGLCTGAEHPVRIASDSHLSRFRNYRGALDQGGQKRRSGRLRHHRRA